MFDDVTKEQFGKRGGSSRLVLRDSEKQAQITIIVCRER